MQLTHQSITTHIILYNHSYMDLLMKVKQISPDNVSAKDISKSIILVILVIIFRGGFVSLKTIGTVGGGRKPMVVPFNGCWWLLTAGGGRWRL